MSDYQPVYINVRAVYAPRRPQVCSLCGQPVLHHIYFYGALDALEPRRAARLHWYCASHMEKPLQAAREEIRDYEWGMRVHLRDFRAQRLEHVGGTWEGGWLTPGGGLTDNRAMAEFWAADFALRRKLLLEPHLMAYPVASDVRLYLERGIDPRMQSKILATRGEHAE